MSHAPASAGTVAPCAACAATPQRAFYLGGHFVYCCPSCGLYVLNLANSHNVESMLDPAEVEPALRPIRLRNYAHILKVLGPWRDGKLLDVGCSSGWFLTLAIREGFRCHGMEPDGFFYENIQREALAGAEVVHGSFPDDVPSRWGPFDIITFHDVFEHLPDPTNVLNQCRQLLSPRGVIAFSLPMAEGFVFRLARLLYHLGIPAPLGRVFQIHYPYPHLYYFTRPSFLKLAQQSGFEAAHVERLRSFSVRGALHRVRMDSTLDPINSLKRYASAAALVGFAILEPVMPADNMLILLRPKP